MNRIPDTILRKDGETEESVSRPYSEPTPVATISGTVFKDEDGDGRYCARCDTPIPGAMVSARASDRVLATAYTDEFGKYTLSVPLETHCTLKAHLYSGACYDPELKAWGAWSAIEGQKDIRHPSEAQDISVSYRVLNYGARDFSWELWHKGPIFKRKNVILIHGFRFPGASRRGRCDNQFGRLDDLLQTKEAGFNVWQFEYADRSLGTLGTVAAYASEFAGAVARIAELTGADSFSVVGYSMGGIIARQYIAAAGKSRIDRLLTLATPHMGTIRFEPFSLKWPDKFIPRAGVELRPDSRFLWDLNTNIESSSIPELAAIGGYAWGHNDGFIEMSSTSLGKFNPDGTVAESFYFVAVNRSHTNINHITSEQDEVFRLIHSFLRDGVQGIRSMRPSERPGDYHVPYSLIFTLKEMPRWRMIYPFVVVTGKRRRYRGFKVFSQGAKTGDDSYIFTVQLRPDDEGEARIYYARDRYATVMLQKGQSTIVKKPLDSGFAVPEKSTLKTKWAKATV